MESLAHASLSDNTHSAYSSATKSFIKFYSIFTNSPPVLSLAQLPPSAASDVVFSAFAAFLADKGLAASTIEAYSAGVRTSLKMTFPTLPLFSWKASRAKRVCEGIARSYPSRGRGQSNPLTLSIISRAVSYLFPEQQLPYLSLSVKSQFITVTLWLFSTGSRASELLDSATNRGLHFNEIRFINEESGATQPFSSLLWGGPAVVLIGRSKTDQRSEGAVKTIPNLIIQSELCPMRWAQYFFDLSGQQATFDETQLFFTLNYAEYSSIFSDVMNGLGEKGCTPHGTKSGATTHLASAGTQEGAISRQIMWKTQKTQAMVSHYSHRSLQESLRLQRLMFSEASPILLKPLRSTFHYPIDRNPPGST